MNEIDQVAVLGDATRRQIFEFLTVHPSSVGELATRLPVTRSAVSQHLRVLKDAGLVAHRSQGTRNVYHIDPEGLAKLRAYLDKLWASALDEFKQAAESGEQTKSKKGRSKS